MRLIKRIGRRTILEREPETVTRQSRFSRCQPVVDTIRGIAGDGGPRGLPRDNGNSIAVP